MTATKLNGCSQARKCRNDFKHRLMFRVVKTANFLKTIKQITFYSLKFGVKGLIAHLKYYTQKYVPVYYS